MIYRKALNISFRLSAEIFSCHFTAALTTAQLKNNNIVSPRVSVEFCLINSFCHDNRPPLSLGHFEYNYNKELERSVGLQILPLEPCKILVLDTVLLSR